MNWLKKWAQGVKSEKKKFLSCGEQSGQVTMAEQSSELSPNLPGDMEGSDAKREVLAKLSPREQQVLVRLLEGMKMREIAGELEIQTSTVNGYCREIYRKLGVNSKAMLILRYADAAKQRRKGGDTE